MRRTPLIVASLFPAMLSAQNAPATRLVADTSQHKVALASRRSGDVSIDGRLDEAAWQAAQPFTGFIQSYPKPNEKSPDQTEFRVLYDDAAIYVGARMFDSHPDSIAAQLARRDAGGIYSDWLHLIIDSYHDRRTAFRFTVNPVGVKKDVYTSDDGNEDVNWDAVWDVATRIDSLGWTAEYRIPLSQLRFGNQGKERVWGFQIMRDIARRNERDTWNPWTPTSGGFVSRFGDLSGLVDVPTPQRLEVLPYVSSKLTRAPGTSANPFFKSNDVKPSAGADLRVGLPAGMTLTATVNPDFGQVEVDPSVVNLSAFETFFPEKRPFFLEGSDIFNFGQIITNNDYGSVRYFYSRRIGRQPQRFAGGPNVLFFNSPAQTTIAGAAKITGKSGPYTLGLLEAVTPEEKADILLSDGTRTETPVEPLTNYLVGRGKVDFRKGATTVGGMVTSTIRAVSDNVFSNLLRKNATFGGLDFQSSTLDRRWNFSGFLSGSSVGGTRQSIAATQLNSSHYYQRPDADYLEFDSTRTRLNGYTGEIAVAKNGDWFGSLNYKEVNPGLELNDIGFHGRTDYRALSSLYGYQRVKSGKHLRQFNMFGYNNETWNFGGDHIYDGTFTLGGNATFLNLWGLSGRAGFTRAYDDDRLTRGGPVARYPATFSSSISANTDTRKLIWFSSGYSFTHESTGGLSQNLSFSADMRPRSNVHINFGPSVSHNNATRQFVRSVTDPLAVDTYGRRYVFADLDQTTLALDTRVEWTFTPLLSLQVYAQPFVAAGRYSNFKEFLKPRTLDYAVYGDDKGTITRSASGVYTVDPDGAGAAPAFAFGDPNFNVRNLVGNAVLRWEYKPGSAIFFVWQQSRNGFEPIGDFAAGRDIGDIFKTVPTNVFLVKATYWLGR